MPVGANRGAALISAANGVGVGWLYEEASGQIDANATATELDAAGKPYSDY